MKDPAFAKFVVFINSAVPLAMLGWDAAHHGLGADPVAFAIRTTGMLTLVFLTLSLTVTPLRLITGWNWLSNFRRMLGLYAFFYGCVHLSLYFGFDRGLSVGGTIDDVIQRPFILFGMTGFLLMVPLALTSTNASIKRLGAARWKSLHRLVYLAAIAGIIHFYMLVKADTRLPIAFGTALAILLSYRIYAAVRRAGKTRRRSRPGFPVVVQKT